MELMLKKHKLTVSSPVKINASVSIGRNEANGLGLAVRLTGEFEGISAEQADKVLSDAHLVCPYSVATRNNVEVTLDSVVKGKK